MFNIFELVSKYELFADTSSLMCENGKDFFMIDLLSALQKNKKQIHVLSNVKGELKGLTKDEYKRECALSGLRILEAYENFGVLDLVNYPYKTIADGAFLDILLKERINGDICLITEDRRLAKDVIVNFNNLESVKSKYKLAALRLLYGEPKFWDYAQIDSQLGLSEIEAYTIMNENQDHKLLLSFAIDNSATMNGERMEKFNRAFFEFTDRLRQKDIEKSVEYSINIFEGFEPRGIKNFTDDDFNHAILLSGRMPFLNKSLNKTIAGLEKRIAELNLMGAKHYKPWLIVFTDGLSFDKVDESMEKIRNIDNGNVMYLPFMLSDKTASSELDSMMNFPHKRPLTIIDNNFKEMFDWLYLMLAKRLATPMEKGFKLDKDLLKGWAK